MSVSEAIIQWLYTNTTIDIDKSIDTDQLAAEAAAYGLYKTPQTVVVPYVNGDRDITAYYSFLVRQKSSQEATRKRSQAWLEDLETWVRTQNRSRVLPVLGENRECHSVGIANSYTLHDANEKDAVYHLSLAINYTETAT